MKGRFWVIEGLDGCGKSTQLELLKATLTERERPFKYIHFPMLNKGIYGTLVAEFLRGEYGPLEAVHPKLVALLFANDREEHAHTIRRWLDEGYDVLADRYVYSNIAFQCAKLASAEERERLKKWILDFEFGTNALPRPDKSFFLNVPFSFIERSLSQKRVGEDRDYLNGKEDIHEQSLDLQRHVYEVYCSLLKEREDLVGIDCFDAEHRFLPKEEIHRLIVGKLKIEN
ncbi:MAG: thymidylate kinase [Mediterranea sp.]|jgi:dTMP kinase|nr:thymidylate kinase [Mediterranea sp.]